MLDSSNLPPRAIPMLSFGAWRDLWAGGALASILSQPASSSPPCGKAGRHRPARIVSNDLLASGIAGPRDWLAVLARTPGEATSSTWRRNTPMAKPGKPRLPAGRSENAPENPNAVRRPRRLVVSRFPRLWPSAPIWPNLAAKMIAWRRSTMVVAGRQLHRSSRNSYVFMLHWLIEDPVVHAINRRIVPAVAVE